MVKIEKFTEEDMQKDPEAFFTAIPKDEIIDIKDAPYEDKVRFTKYCLDFPHIINTAVITNLAMLVYGTKITDDVFEDPRIFFSSLEEYVDAKYDLKPEIHKFGNDLLKYYFSAIKSYTIILPDGKLVVPGAYKAVLMASTTKDISKIMNIYSVATDQLVPIFDADEIVDSFIFTDCKPVQDFISVLMDGLKNDRSE